MTREDERFYKAVLSLNGHPDFEIIRDRIKMKYATVCSTWWKQSSDKYPHFAGQAQALATLISDLDTLRAMSELEATKRATEKPNPGSTL